jgi:hypothetical protein
LTAREYAQAKQIANATNHKLAEVLRKSLEDFLTKNKEVIINCRSKNYLSKPLKSNNNNNNKQSLSPKNKLTYKESFVSVDASDSQKYIEKLEEYIARPDADVLIRELYKLELKDLREKNES